MGPLTFQSSLAAVVVLKAWLLTQSWYLAQSHRRLQLNQKHGNFEGVEGVQVHLSIVLADVS
jgi:hypothetical protein